jgi:hypothetical protein
MPAAYCTHSITQIYCSLLQTYNLIYILQKIDTTPPHTAGAIARCQSRYCRYRQSIRSVLLYTQCSSFVSSSRPSRRRTRLLEYILRWPDAPLLCSTLHLPNSTIPCHQFALTVPLYIIRLIRYGYRVESNTSPYLRGSCISDLRRLQTGCARKAVISKRRQVWAY